jgi:hypothetical protein
MKERGIRHETTSPDTPKQNGNAEWLNQSLFNYVQTILIDSRLPLFLWPEVVNYMYIVHTKNCHSAYTLTNTTLYEVWYKKKPNVSIFQPFGCKVYVWNHSSNWKKFDTCAFEGVFVGYANIQKAYRIYLPFKQTIISSIHVCFDNRTNMGCSFSAKREIQFQYNTLFHHKLVI